VGFQVLAVDVDASGLVVLLHQVPRRPDGNRARVDTALSQHRERPVGLQCSVHVTRRRVPDAPVEVRCVERHEHRSGRRRVKQSLVPLQAHPCGFENRHVLAFAGLPEHRNDAGVVSGGRLRQRPSVLRDDAEPGRFSRGPTVHLRQVRVQTAHHATPVVQVRTERHVSVVSNYLDVAADLQMTPQAV
jgi:hypothetical protein